jgi:ParB family chromosome partitioning protein
MVVQSACIPAHRIDPPGVWLPVDSIEPNPDNPRRTFGVAGLDALAESIKRWGQLQPVVVRRLDDRSGRYQLVCGERRWRAHVRADLPTIWAIERETPDAELLAVSLVENLQHVGLTHAEKVAALDQLAEFAETRGLRRTARELHMNPGWLSGQLALRRHPEIFAELEQGRLSFGQATELQRAPAHARARLVTRVVEAGGVVTTAVIRDWVRQARGVAPVAKREGEPELSTYATLGETLRWLGAPPTPAARAELQALIRLATQLLGEPEPKPAENPPAVKVIAREVRCLLCGEHVGDVGPGGFRPRGSNTSRWQRGRLVCGRCSGSVS